MEQRHTASALTKTLKTALFLPGLDLRNEFQGHCVNGVNAVNTVIAPSVLNRPGRG